MFPGYFYVQRSQEPLRRAPIASDNPIGERWCHGLIQMRAGGAGVRRTSSIFNGGCITCPQYQSISNPCTDHCKRVRDNRRPNAGTITEQDVPLAGH
jgi:hypothetical protein